MKKPLDEAIIHTADNPKGKRTVVLWKIIAYNIVNIIGGWIYGIEKRTFGEL